MLDLFCYEAIKFLTVHVIFGPKKITCHISDTTAKHVIKLPGCPCPGKAKYICDNK